MGLPENIEDILKIGSGIFWSLAYILIIMRGFKDKTYGMPLLALCANLSWEFIFSFIYPRDAPQSYINITWFFLDLAIIYQILRFGPGELKDLLPRRYFYPAFFASLVISFLIILGISMEFENYNGMYSAFGQNLLMSVLFVVMLLRRDSLRGQSIYIAVLKLIGTVLASVVFFARDPSSVLMLTLYISIFIFDVVYVGMVYQYGKRADAR